MNKPDPRSLLATLTDLEQRQSASPGGALRHYRRFVVRGEAELRPVDRTRLDQQPIAVQLRDVGLGGVGFLTPCVLAPDTLWHIEFGEQDLTIGFTTIVVRHCRPIQDGVYLVGSQFCIDTGMLYLLGVNPTDIHNSLLEDTRTSASFLPPSAVA